MPRLFYFCFSHNRPSGGIKQIYRHVDILNRHGFDAQVLHSDRDFRVTWFENQTRTTDIQRFQHDVQTDIIVVPEDLGTGMVRIPGRKVIFNQNAYYGFASFGEEAETSYPYLDPEILGVFTVSEHNAEYLRFAYPGANVLRIWYGVDRQRFSRCPLPNKQKQIACIVKNQLELYTLYHILRSRARQGLNALDEYRWVFLGDRTEADVARILHDSLALIFLSTSEGLPLTPLEAMLSGCLVAAYDAGPLPEYLPTACRFRPHDLLGVAGWLEELARSFPAESASWEAVSDTGYDVARQFSLEREEESLLGAWRQLLSR
jgi:glycosyltransferase involved in cell wall biosynthesis